MSVAAKVLGWVVAVVKFDMFGTRVVLGVYALQLPAVSALVVGLGTAAAGSPRLPLSFLLLAAALPLVDAVVHELGHAVVAVALGERIKVSGSAF